MTKEYPYEGCPTIKKIDMTLYAPQSLINANKGNKNVRITKT